MYKHPWFALNQLILAATPAATNISLYFAEKARIIFPNDEILPPNIPAAQDELLEMRSGAELELLWRN